MDADTRHELKQNELAEALWRVRLLAEKYWKHAVAVVVAIVVIAVGLRVWSVASSMARDSAWSAVMAGELNEDAQADPLTRLRAVMAETSDPALLAAARLRAARQLIDKESSDAAQRSANLKEAQQLLTQAASDRGAPALLRAAARFGAASLDESLNNLDAARTSYQALVDDKEFEQSPFRALAATRLGTLDGLKLPVSFTPGTAPPPPPPPGSVQPATQPAATTQAAQPATQQPATTQPVVDPATDATPATENQPKPDDSQPAEVPADETPVEEKPGDSKSASGLTQNSAGMSGGRLRS